MVRIAITGDVCIMQSEKIIIDNSVAKLLSSFDYRIANLEGPIGNKNSYQTIKKSGPSLVQSEVAIDFIRHMHADALSLANNHMMDYGKEALYDTKNKFTDLQYIGAGNWDEAYKPLIVEKDNLHIAIFSFSEMQFGMLSDEWSQREQSVGCAWVNHHKVNEIIHDFKSKMDYVIVIVHAGVENIEVPLPEWRNRYRELISNGCDAVIAHHPHIVQGFEMFKGKPICYSLGNFCFPLDRATTKWTQGAIAEIVIEKDSLSIKLYGCKMNGNVLSIINEEDWQSQLNDLCALLNEDVYMDKVNATCRELVDHYWQLFSCGGLFNPKKIKVKDVCRYFLGKTSYVHVLNNIQCESHRWCIERGLKNIIR